MASFHRILQHTKPQLESPAKIFAKLKSRVQREEMCANEPLVREKHGGGFRSPRKKPESAWITDELSESQRLGPYRGEAQALTISPISSPQKTCRDSYFDISRKHAEEVSSWDECTPRKRAYMESTAVSHPLPLCNRATQIHPKPPHTGHRDGFMVTTNRTPVKMQPGEEDCRRSGYVEDSNLVDKLESPALLSPSRKRLRVRVKKPEPHELNKLSSSTNKVRNGAVSPPQQRKVSSALSDHDTDNAPMENLGDAGGSLADRSGMNTFAQKSTLPPRSTTIKPCRVILDQTPLMSPAKMFAYMKERKNKAEQQAVHEVSRRDLFDDCTPRQSEDTPSTVLKMNGVEALRDAVPADRSREVSAESQSDTDPPEDVQIPADPSRSILLEDPLVLKTPSISIPKKHSPVFKRNKWPGMAKFPSESVIYLKKWFLRKNHKGLFVNGIHQEENILWNSNIITDRVSNSVLKTVSGRVYVLVGKMNLNIESELPNWLLKKFFNGFPANWKALYKKFLSETNKEKTRNKEKKDPRSKTQSTAASANLSVKQRKQNPLRTPASCPPAPVHSKQVSRSRSGRTIKPPLEYWRGGRVLLDAHMNVTIHECYETSICIPEVTTTMSTRASKKPVCVFLPHAEGHAECESASSKETPAPRRRVKAPPRKSHKAKVCPEERPALSPEPPRTVSRRKKAVSSSPEFATDDGKSKSSDCAVLSGRTRRQKVYTKKGRHGANKSKISTRFSSGSSSASPKDSPSEIKRTTKVTQKEGAAQTQKKPKQGKSTKISPPTTLSTKSTQSIKKATTRKSLLSDEDRDEWTEAELKKLREAVSYYPKHKAGYWAKVARMVGTRSAEECHSQHTSQGTYQTPAEKPGRPQKQKKEAPKDPDQPVISARVGTLRRKKEVRQFLEAMPTEDVDDVFSSACMKNRRFEMPSMCPSEDQDFALSDLGALTPRSTAFPEVKTPKCLLITPSMMGSPNMSNDDKYVFQLQKRMKKNQFNVCTKAPSSKKFTPTPSAKQMMKRCGNAENDSFVVWEMFPGNNVEQSDSEEEEDFYFSDND